MTWVSGATIRASAACKFQASTTASAPRAAQGIQLLRKDTPVSYSGGDNVSRRLA